MLKHVVQLTGLTALAVALSVGSVAQAAPVASVLTGDEMAFAFAAPVATDGVQVLSQGEMQATEGAVLQFVPLILGGVRIAFTGFTRHGLNQVISRNGVGVSNQAIMNTMRNPTQVTSQISNQTTKFKGPEATVVLNQRGQVVTAYGKPR